MTSLDGSFRILLSSSPSECTHSTFGGVRDVSGLDQAVDLASRPFDGSNYEWVDPRVLDIPTYFRGPYALDNILSKVSILKLDSPSDVVAANSCNHTDQVCHG